MEHNCEKHYQTLISPLSTVDQRYTAIFELKTLNTEESVNRLKDAFPKLSQHKERSCLILHEVAYALGQVDEKYSKILFEFLRDIVVDEQEFDVVRHEAAEALANLSPELSIEVLQKFSGQNQNDQLNILRDTCLLGLQKIKSITELNQLYGQDYSGTKEPAAPFKETELAERLGGQINVQNLVAYLEDESIELFDKYRALYYIRNTKSHEYIMRMTELLLSQKLGALIKHEVVKRSLIFQKQICFILGQLGNECPKTVLEVLIQVSSDEGCPAIVRHEALAAFQTVHTSKEECKQFLLKFVEDKEQIVRETAQVSLKVSEYWNE